MTTGDDWAGRVGEVWAAEATAMNRLMRPPGDAAIAGLGSVDGQKVLDLGCGAGQSSRALAGLGAEVTGLDISPYLLGAARDAGGGAYYLLADAASEPLRGPYDVLYSRFGGMFFDDPPAAWRHIYGEVGPECRVAMAAWQGAEENEWAHVPVTVGREVLGDAIALLEPGTAPGPFAWADKDYVSNLLSDAGFQNIRLDAYSFDVEISMGDDPDPVERAVQFCLTSGPLASRLRHVAKDQRRKVGDALATRFQQHIADKAVKVAANAWIITGTS